MNGNVWKANPIPRETDATEIDYQTLQPQFCWLPVDLIKRSFKATTQFAKLPASAYLWKRYKSPHPACNVYQWNEDIASDTVFSDTPAIDNSAKSAQIFFGTKTMVTNVEDLKSQSGFPSAFQDNVRKRGAPNRLLVDSAKVECSEAVLTYLRLLCIGLWQSEPYHQHQNATERRWQTVKRITNRILAHSGADASLWLEAIQYVCFVLNHVAHPSLDYCVPLEVLKGCVQDISPILVFRWYEPVYYMVDDSSFPSKSVEARGRFVGFAENVGHIMTFQILTDDTKRIICRSSVRSAIKAGTHNRRLENLDLNDIYQVPDPSNPVIYEKPTPISENGEDFLRFSDQEFAFVHFHRGIKITKFIDKKPVTGIIL